MAVTSSPVLITGATGFIGAEVVRQLLESGYQVRGTTRDLQRATDLTALAGASDRLELVQADLLDEGSIRRAAAGCEYVMHVASPFVLNVADPQRDLVDPAVNGTVAALRAAAATESVTRVVLTSSFAAISGPPEGRVFSEDDWNTEATLDFYSYAYSKTQAERAAWSFMDDESPRFDLVVVNPVTVIGPSIVPRVNESASFFIGMTNGSQPAIVAVDALFVDVRDVALAHVRAMETPTASGRHLLAAGTSSLRHLRNLGRDVLGDKYRFPRFHLDTGLGVPLSRSFLIFQPRGTRDYLKTALGRPHHVDTTKARRELGIEFRDLDDTIRETWLDLDRRGLLGRKVEVGDWGA